MGLAEVAGAQCGMAARPQLLELGFSPSSIQRRLRRGLLHRKFQGVYAVGNPTLAPFALETAALLFAGDDCVISHESAAALWGLSPAPPTVVVTAVGRRPQALKALRVHRVATLHPDDVRLHHGLPVTAPARTLIDFAARAARGDLERALNEARVLKLVSDASLAQALERAPRRTGAARLRALIGAQGGPAFTRSEAERLLRALLVRAQLRPTRLNTIVAGCEVDALWADQRIVVEVDGFAAHGHRAAFENDRLRDQRLIAAGYTVIRVTWRQLVEEPVAVAVRIAQALVRATAEAERQRGG